jgi:hypothetical protein
MCHRLLIVSTLHATSEFSGRKPTSSKHSHEEQRPSQISEEAHNPSLQQIEQAAPTMEQSNDRVHAVAREQICPSQDHHDQTNWKDHGGDGSDETWRIGLEPRRSVRRKG